VYHASAKIPFTAYGMAFCSVVVPMRRWAWYEPASALPDPAQRRGGHSLVALTTYALLTHRRLGRSGAIVPLTRYSTKGLSIAENRRDCRVLRLHVRVRCVSVARRRSRTNPHRAPPVPFSIWQRRGWSEEGHAGLRCVLMSRSCLRLKPLVLGKMRLTYPRINYRVDAAGRRCALELFGAAGINYFALRMPATPLFSMCGVFVASFRLRSSSHAQRARRAPNNVFVKAHAGITDGQGSWPH